MRRKSRLLFSIWGPSNPSTFMVVGDSLGKLVKKIFENLRKLEEVNETFIFQRLTKFKNMKNFKLISLCNVASNIVTNSSSKA
ncbi:hypothetical protein CR513_10274, partial [Mucuna pruriens]